MQLENNRGSTADSFSTCGTTRGHGHTREIPRILAMYTPLHHRSKLAIPALGVAVYELFGGHLLGSLLWCAVDEEADGPLYGFHLRSTMITRIIAFTQEISLHLQDDKGTISSCCPHCAARERFPVQLILRTALGFFGKATSW